MSKGFASTADLAEKRVSFDEIGPDLYAYTAEGDPNSGVIVGDDAVMVVDAQATPAMAEDVIARIRRVTDKPIRWLVLSHYHAVRVLGAAAYRADHIVASAATRALIVERGAADMESEIGRFPRLFRGRDTIPGLTWPSLTFAREITLWLGQREVRILHAGRAHTAGDTVVWLPRERVLFAGDTVEFGATPYCGDAHFTDWPATLAGLRALDPVAMVPGRGAALTTPEDCRRAIEGTEAFTTRLYALVRAYAQRGAPLKETYDAAMSALRPDFGHWVIFEHCMPFNVSRAYDEALGIDRPRVWTAARDLEMWRALEGGGTGGG
ncbi:MBL fold metallo-hydrolase [Elioraea sp. Yellowstone]|jgi:glyoxylase-like metal-dependent hydrolase (beta-lactamase superfamily II)|uniref:MBL fold metallo-hydrolase n=1 Tax=Elioraea sp. Yellowstone TaxID=2592070 RepID=UPI001153EA6D|nr:MBL fold metallo-hydrolase [Elioraea sp. Yellowstone]TQF84807.1 MBL fold metallo-hydrolase [Elioraea sp. Yellowstone]